MAENKTTENDGSVAAFLATVADEQKRKDCEVVLKMMHEETGHVPKMWGTSIVGFGRYHYKYESGREGDFFWTGFSPRKQNLTLYIMQGFERHQELMQKLGKHSTGKSCLYIKRLSDVDLDVLRELIQITVRVMRRKH